MVPEMLYLYRVLEADPMSASSKRRMHIILMRMWLKMFRFLCKIEIFRFKQNEWRGGDMLLLLFKGTTMRPNKTGEYCVKVENIFL
jgi:hypothetical protein